MDKIEGENLLSLMMLMEFLVPQSLTYECIGKEEEKENDKLREEEND